jgi:hypothetical protein
MKDLRLWSFPRNPTIASGATPIGSADHAPDEKKRKGNLYAGHDNIEKAKSKYFWVYTQFFFLTIASGATPIGSAGRAPDETAVIRIMEQALEHIIDYLVKRWTFDIVISWVTPIGRDLRLTEDKQPKDFGYWKTVKQGSRLKLWFLSCVIAIKLEYHDCKRSSR